MNRISKVVWGWGVEPPLLNPGTFIRRRQNRTKMPMFNESTMPRSYNLWKQ